MYFHFLRLLPGFFMGLALWLGLSLVPLQTHGLDSQKNLPQQELRGVWMASAWNLDWPPSGGSAEFKKNRLIAMLDSLKNAHINAVFFQVRPNADALYESSYEPWSRFLTGVRGQHPGYDPLAFMLSEAHKRGIEVHAWLNPYRFENTAGEYSGMPGDFSATHPELIITSGGKTYFDPGHPGTTQHIKMIVADLIERYDLDGVVFDDYFYPPNIASSVDQHTFDQFADPEVILSYYPEVTRGNFRRTAVNEMIRQVNDTIKHIKPWLLFGVSPAGIYTTNPNVAAWYNTTLPQGITGNDNYNTIYCDPLAWLTKGALDYISPQLYWPIGGNQDYLTLVAWWAYQAARFDRHCYPSMGTYRLPGDARMEEPPGRIPAFLHELKRRIFPSRYEGDLPDKNLYTLQEIENQILANRNNAHNNVFGGVFYRASDLTGRVPGLAPFLRQGVFAERAVMAPVSWLESPQPDLPQILSIGTLADQPDIAMLEIESNADRFLVFGSAQVPALSESVFMQMSFGQPFSRFYHNQTGSLSVAAYNRARQSGPATEAVLFDPLEFPHLQNAFEGEEACQGDFISWNPVAEATDYQVFIYADVFEQQLLAEISSQGLTELAVDPALFTGQNHYYYRVRARDGIRMSWSVPDAFWAGWPVSVSVNSPQQGEVDVPLNTVVQWEILTGVSGYHVQVAESGAFSENELIIDQEGITANILHISLSQHNQKYYLRVRALNPCGPGSWSEVIEFTTISPTSAPQQELNPKIRVFPNPAREQVQLAYAESFGRREIQLFNAKGQSVRQWVLDHDALSDQLDIGSLPAGIYTGRLTSPGNSQRKPANLVFRIMITE